MADQTVKIQETDVAATAWTMARYLWSQETGNSPKASDAKFMALTSLCVSTLLGHQHTESAQKEIENLFGK